MKNQVISDSKNFSLTQSLEPIIPNQKNISFNFSKFINEMLEIKNKAELGKKILKEDFIIGSLKIPPSHRLKTNNGDVKKVTCVASVKRFVEKDGTFKTFEPENYNSKQSNMIQVNDKVYFIIDFKDKNKDKSVVVEFINNDVDAKYAEDYLEKGPNPDEEQLALVLRYMLSMGAKFERSFLEQSNRQILSWSENEFSSYYTSEIENYYTNIHRYIADYLSKHNKKNNDAVTLYSFGCGAGDELKTIGDKFSEEGVKLEKAVAIDVNQNNFRTNKSKWNDERFQWIKGDVNKLSEIKLEDKNDTTIKIGLFLGLLVERCMEGSVKALNVLQQASFLDQVIICGITGVLLNKNMIKSAGFDVIQKQLTDSATSFKNDTTAQNDIIKYVNYELTQFYYLTKMSQDRRKSYLYNKAVKRSSNTTFDCLDLSMSHDPLGDLKLFSIKKLDKIKQVDISWAKFNSKEEIQPFMEELKGLKQEKLFLLISPIQEHKEDLLNYIAECNDKFMVVERRDASNTKECPAFQPNVAKQYGIYTRLPNQRL